MLAVVIRGGQVKVRILYYERDRGFLEPRG